MSRRRNSLINGFGSVPSRALLGTASLACLAALGACNSTTAPTPRAVTSGSVTGVAFHVTQGVVYQVDADGPIKADSVGAVIVLDQTPAGLGMSDPKRLHLRTQFALSNHGSLRIAAFGTTGDELNSGVWAALERESGAVGYELHLSSPTAFAGDVFTPPLPDIPWVATEAYAQDVPGYGAGSGITMWQLSEQDDSPVFGADVLGCTNGPAAQMATLSGDRVAYSMSLAFIVAIEVVDTIVGPCK
jgi:hypothetical protein